MINNDHGFSIGLENENDFFHLNIFFPGPPDSVYEVFLLGRLF